MPLDRQSIVATAFEVLEKGGIEGLSTRKLAEALGVSGPSLYWHFKTKRELFDQMAEAMLSKALEPSVKPPAEFDWVGWLAEGARNIRREILSHRDGAHILVGYRLTAASAAKGPPTVLILSRLGLDPADSWLILRTMGRLVVGWTLDEQTSPPEGDPDTPFEFALSLFVKGAEAKVAELLAQRTAIAG